MRLLLALLVVFPGSVFASGPVVIPNSILLHGNLATVSRPAVANSWVSAESNVDGVCRYFGFLRQEAKIPTKLTPIPVPAVVLDETGAVAMDKVFSPHIRRITCVASE